MLTAFPNVEVDKFDQDFEGVQLATEDDFNMLINQGYSDAWKVDPKKLEPYRVQFASMRDKGTFTRGWFLNADIDRTEEIIYNNEKRHRIYFKNPVIINTGNPNVKFKQNPVAYIKKKK